jgi:hypothetical protein
MKMPQRLACEECGAVADVEVHGWRAYVLHDEDDGPALTVYCPACAEREFGDRTSEDD